MGLTSASMHRAEPLPSRRRRRSTEPESSTSGERERQRADQQEHLDLDRPPAAHRIDLADVAAAREEDRHEHVERDHERGQSGPEPENEQDGSDDLADVDAVREPGRQPDRAERTADPRDTVRRLVDAVEEQDGGDAESQEQKAGIGAGSSARRSHWFSVRMVNVWTSGTLCTCKMESTVATWRTRPSP